MHLVDFIVKGFVAGFAISAPVGPVNIFCISRGMEKGRNAAILAGFGAACVDTFYGGIAGFSFHYLIHFLISEEFWIRLVGGGALITIGLVYYFRRPKPLHARMQSSRSDFLSALLLNLTNPTTVLTFLAVLALLHLQRSRGWTSLYLVAGIFVGAMAWWSILASMSSRFRDRFNDRTVRRMNRLAGIGISLFGIVNVALSGTEIH